jgi:polysaccharide pyruvyl transferase WcaK-like protein
MTTRPHFLLVGNGPYVNRGCEAIVRGTMAILRYAFGERFRVTLGTNETAENVAKQAAGETDPLITHVALSRSKKRWSSAWWRRQMTRWFIRPYSMLDGFCIDADCAMQIGGDNFTLDYGKPYGFMRLDDHLRRHHVPVLLWGASVGPFEADPEFAREMFAHLGHMRAFFLRESDSYGYLKQHGLENLYRMPDPAFAMDPVEPAPADIGCELPEAAVGLNLSPLMAAYITGGNRDAWVVKSADIVQSIAQATHRSILLIPHVTWAHTNDHTFLCDVAARCRDLATAPSVFCVGDKLSAAETKWVISRCSVFVGARTHSTIAALSSCIPTLSLAYSRKAKGLNQDIFGSQQYCVQPSEVEPDRMASRIVAMLDRRDAIRERLSNIMPAIRREALQTGSVLREVLRLS